MLLQRDKNFYDFVQHGYSDVNGLSWPIHCIKTSQLHTFGYKVIVYDINTAGQDYNHLLYVITCWIDVLISISCYFNCVKNIIMRDSWKKLHNNKIGLYTSQVHDTTKLNYVCIVLFSTTVCVFSGFMSGYCFDMQMFRIKLLESYTVM